MPAPRLTYFTELDAPKLQALFAQPEVVPFLVETSAAISLGIIDLSEERADVVRQLNAAGIPVTAWLLLPRSEGYWFNLDNFRQAQARYAAFRTWTEEHALRWARVGIDIEPDIHAIQALGRHPFLALQTLLERAFRRSRLAAGRRAYDALVEQIHGDGYPVEAYHFPFLLDERAARSTVLQRLTGLVELPNVDHEVMMLYSSFARPWGQGILWNYGAESGSIAVGSTGGGVELEGSLAARPLNWAELQTDLLLAKEHTSAVYVFSLEGCVAQGFLPLLRAIDWKKPVDVPYRAAQRVEDIRQGAQRALWLAARPGWLLFALALLVAFVKWLRRR